MERLPQNRLFTSSRAFRVFCLALLLLAVLVPLLPSDYMVSVATEILIYGLFAVSFNLIYGYMGQISFGHAAFFGLGAYATAILFTHSKSPAGDIAMDKLLLSIAAGPLVACACAMVVGFFCVRLTGIYFAILSLAFGELLFSIVLQWYSFTGGDNGIQGLLPPASLQNPRHYYYFSLAVVAVALLLLRRITESPFGYVMRALRDNQRRTAYLGINVRLHMWLNFVIASTFAGLAGSLWGPFARSVSPGLLGWKQSGLAVFMTMIGGAGSFFGPLLGSAVYVCLEAFVTMFTIYWPLTIGLVVTAIVLFAPGGLSRLIQRALTRKSRDDGATAKGPVAEGRPETLR
jgi:branched-chain amino acid transport system permease protein